MTGHTNVGGSPFNIKTLKMKFEQGREYDKTGYNTNNVLTWTNYGESSRLDSFDIDPNNTLRYLHSGFLTMNGGQIIGVKVNGKYYRFFEIRGKHVSCLVTNQVTFNSVQLLFDGIALSIMFDFPNKKIMFGDGAPSSNANWVPSEDLNIEIYELIEES